MQIVSASDFRNNASGLITQTNQSWDPIAVTNQKKESAVLISLDHWNSLQETMYLLSNPANAQRLLATLSHGKSAEKKLIAA